VVNTVILLGYLRQAPVLSHTPNGTPYTVLLIETERTWRDTEGQKHTEREVHPVQVWRALAEACSQYLRENQLVYVEGRLHTRQWQDDQQRKHQRIDVIAEQVKFLPHYHPVAEK
jgi:single-strand DNA-binding protein